MNSTIENFKKYKPLLFELVSRDLKTKYRRSVLGVLWTVLNPLGMMLVMTVVFSTVFRQNIENFPVYLMCGQLVFNFFILRIFRQIQRLFFIAILLTSGK